MSISVHCEECGKTYQVREEMAGRKGKCPRGHSLYVPAAAAEADDTDDFAFDAGSRFDEAPRSKTHRRSDPKSKEIKIKPAATTASAGDDFNFDAADRNDDPSPRKSRGRSESRVERDEEEEEEVDFRADEDSVDDSPPPKMAKRRDERSTMEMKLAPPPAAAADDFAFTASPTAEPDEKPAPRVGKLEKKPKSKPAPAPVPTDDNDFSFATAGNTAPRNDDDNEVAVVAPSRHGREKGEGPKSQIGRRTAVKQDGGKPMLPLIIGGVLAMLGIGGGVGMFLMGRAQVNPLREEVATLSKRAEKAEQQASAAEAAKSYAETSLADIKKNPPKDPNLAVAEKKATAAEKKVKELEKKLADLQTAPPDPKVDPKGEPMAKTDPGVPPPPPGKEPGAPAGGKNWTATPTAEADNGTFKAGDRLWLFPKEDVVIKAMAGKVSYKFRWQLRAGKQLPNDPYITIFIQEAGFVKQIFADKVTLPAAKGESTVNFTLPKLKGEYRLTFCISDGMRENFGEKMIIYSSMITVPAEF